MKPRYKLFSHLAATGAALSWAGVLTPWQGRSETGEPFLVHAPLAAAAILLLSAALAWAVRQRKPYSTMALLAVTTAVGQVYFSEYYFGVPFQSLLSGEHSFLSVPGWTILEIGLMLMAGAGVGLLLSERMTGGRASPGRGGPEGEISEGITGGLTGRWRLIGAGAGGNLARDVEMMKQTWVFEPGGRLRISLLGREKKAVYLQENGWLTLTDKSSGKVRRLRIKRLTPGDMVLERPGGKGPFLHFLRDQ